MTNAEKYEEVFGMSPDKGSCPTSDCIKCPCNCDVYLVYEWWDSEYDV